MPLHPDAQKVIDDLAALGPMPEPGAISPQEMRAATAAAWVRTGPFEPVGGVEDRTIPGPAGDLRVRVYTPEGDGPFPILVWFHGGGWVIGTLEENEAALRAVCRQAEVQIVSVEYRLAPEDPFPAAVEDAFAALRWAAAQGVPVAVGGESAGGNLAAVCALKARDEGGPAIALQFLVAPVVGRPEDERPSYNLYAVDHFLTRASMEWFFAQYPRRAEDLDDPYCLPLAADDLSGLPPALVMTAEYDVLRDEGEEYARRLQEAGVPCELVRYDGQIHGFFGLLDDKLTVSAEAHAHAAQALRAALAPAPA